MRWRAPTLEDAPAALALITARDIADFGAPDYTLDDLQEEWQGPELDLAADTVVVQEAGEPGRLVGYAIVRRSESLVVVAPDREGRGLGRGLLTWAERREAERGREHHRQRIAAGNDRARELLQAAGYRPRRRYWRMLRRLDEPVHPPLPPDGTLLRGLDVDADLTALHELDALSFSAGADYEPETLAQFQAEHLGAHDLDPELSRVAEGETGIVGFLLARRWREESVGFIDVLAVHPAHHRRGIATAMLTSAFAAFAAAGLREGQLGVASDNPRALGLYERVGMTAAFRVDAYERPVDDQRLGHAALGRPG
jgi:ribosomal protein S18 acetylase RimI-like enzyme